MNHKRKLNAKANRSYESHYNTLGTLAKNIKRLVRKRKFEWRQRYYFYIHLLYIVLFGFVMGNIIYGIERAYTRVSYIDALFMTFSCISLTGLVTVDLTTLASVSQAFLLVTIVFGGFTVTTLPALIIKICLARRRRSERRRRKSVSEQVAVPQTQPERTSVMIVSEIKSPQNRDDIQIVLEPMDEHSQEQELSEVNSVVSLGDLQAPENDITKPTVDGSPRVSALDTSTESSVDLERNSFPENNEELDHRKRREVFDIVREPITESRRKYVEVFLEHKQPPASEIEYLALLWITFLVIATTIVILLIGFVALGLSIQFFQNNGSVNAWWSAFFLTISSFNNCGLTLYSDNLVRFVRYVPVNIFVALLLWAGNTMFPIIFRSLIYLCFRFARKNKIVFKYILDKHHHLTIHLFPALQTRVYGAITIVLLITGMVITLSIDRRNFEEYSVGTYFLISFFQTVSTRSAGFNTIDISRLSTATLLFYIVMMRIKPQMVCNLKDGAFKIASLEEQIRRETKHYSVNANDLSSTMSTPSSSTKTGQSSNSTLNVIDDLLDYGSDIDEPLTRVGALRAQLKALPKTRQTFPLRVKLFLIIHFYTFTKKIWYHSSSLLLRNNLWLVVIIFLICAVESNEIRDNPLEYNFFKVTFEVVSAFGNVGLSLGYTGTPVSFSGAFHTASKIAIVFTMVMGRHRGLYGSMVDQEVETYSKKSR